VSLFSCAASTVRTSVDSSTLISNYGFDCHHIILTSPRAAGTIEEVWKATFLEQNVNDAC
jgi:hypothetical protein